MRRNRFLLSTAVAVGMAATVTACGSSSSTAPSSDVGTHAPTGSPSGTVVIATAGFTEVDVLAAMYDALLKNAGYATKITTVTNRELYEPALEKGEVSLVPDYAATMVEFLNRKANGADAAVVATSDATATVAAGQKLADPLGLRFLQPAQAVDQNGFAVTKKFAEDNKITTLSELAALGKEISFSAPVECPARPFCAVGLKDTYGLKLKLTSPTKFDSPETKQDVKTGKADMGLVGTTDGTLEGLGLVVLKDDKGLQLADNLVPVVGKAYANDANFAGALNKLSTVLTTEDLAQLNLKVDSDREKPADVATAYLKEKGLIKG